LIFVLLYGVDLDTVSCLSSSTLYFITLRIMCVLRKEVKWFKLSPFYSFPKGGSVKPHCFLRRSLAGVCMTLVGKSSCQFIFRVRISLLFVFFTVHVVFIVDLVVSHVYSTSAWHGRCASISESNAVCGYHCRVWLIVPVHVSLGVCL